MKNVCGQYGEGDTWNSLMAHAYHYRLSLLDAVSEASYMSLCLAEVYV